MTSLPGPMALSFRTASSTETEPGAHQHRPLTRHHRVRLRQFSVVLESDRQAALPRCHFDFVDLRRWRQQFGPQVYFQTRPGAFERFDRAADSRCPLSSVLLEVQSDRATLLSASGTSLQRHVVRYARDRRQSHASSSDFDRITNHGERHSPCYETGRNATDEMKQQLQIKYDELLPKWNYTAVPKNRQ